MSLTVHIYTSTIKNGNMKPADGNYESVLDARRAFLEAQQLRAEDTTLVHLTYESNDFRRYRTIDASFRGDGITRPASIEVDALVTTQPNHVVFLPLADCIGAVIYDHAKNILMMSHLGRHNLLQHGGTHSVNYLVDQHSVNPSDLTVWLSPAAGMGSYPLFAFNNRSLHDVAVEQLAAAGMPIKNIEVSPIDSSTDPLYYSHSQFLKGARDCDGRFAIAAVMR